jgi:hypothetical protein
MHSKPDEELFFVDKGPSKTALKKEQLKLKRLYLSVSLCVFFCLSLRRDKGRYIDRVLDNVSKVPPLRSTGKKRNYEEEKVSHLSLSLVCDNSDTSHRSKN